MWFEGVAIYLVVALCWGVLFLEGALRLSGEKSSGWRRIALRAALWPVVAGMMLWSIFAPERYRGRV